MAEKENKYLELYKKYRPKRWEDVIGQDTVVESLKNMIKTQQISTALLFSGKHGCGKTTCAFLFAKALNCPHTDENGNPCNECEICKAIDNRTQLGFNYISLANDGSVDNIRRIMNEGQLAQPIKHPVYILDEAHNLSSAAFDSLLIPLENENSNTIYIFCSNEENKIKPAVLSRLQIKKITPIPNKTLANLLLEIVKKENLKVTKEQIIECVRNGNNSARDTIQNLETIVNGGTLTNNYNSKVIDVIHSKNLVEAYKLVIDMNNEGQVFSTNLDNLFEDLTYYYISNNMEEDFNGYEKNKFNNDFLEKALYIVGEQIIALKNKIADNKILFEIALTKCIMLARKYN